MLDASQCAQNITNSYLPATGLDANGKPSGNPPVGDYPAAFAAAYNNYAKAGIVLGATNTGGDASIIENFMRGVNNRENTVEDFAEAMAQFWATVAITPGIPAHGGIAVISVTNDAADKVNEFRAAILASLTTSESKPYFFQFISNLEDAVKTITWVVTEMMPGTPPAPAPWPEVIT